MKNWYSFYKYMQLNKHQVSANIHPKSTLPVERFISFKCVIFFSFFLIVSCYVHGQTALGRVIAQNSKQAGSSIEVKWYSQQLTYPQGVNIYRRDYPNGRWIKLNTSPIMKLADLPAEMKEKDEDLNLFVEVMKEARPEHLTGLLLVNIMAESFVSNDFSRFLGIWFKDESVIAGKTYQYKVHKIYEKDEILVGQSEPVTAGAYTPLASPAGFYAKMAHKKVQIGWTPDDAGFYAVNVYRKSANSEIRLNVNPVLITQITDSSNHYVYPEVKFVDDSIAEGITYQYSIAGVDLFGNETKRTSFVAITIPDQTPPPAPQNLALTVDKYSVTLNWEIVAAPDLVGFFIYRSSDDSIYNRLSNELLIKSTGMYIDKVPHNGGYYYYVSAVDNSGNETPSQRQFKDVKDVFPPKAPQGLIASSDTGKIMLKWTPNTEPDLKGYLIYRQTITGKKSGDFVLMNATPIKQNEFVNNLPKNTKNMFMYRVAAMDTSYNKSDYSNIAGAHMPDIKAPDKPYIKNISYADGYITVEWIPNADADLKAYNLYSRATKDSTANFKMVNANPIPARQNSYTDKWAKANTSYTYYLVAIDSMNNQSEPSEYFEAFAKVKDQKYESQVKNLRGTVKDKNVELGWQLNTSPYFKGCVVFRGEGNESMKPVSGMLTTDKFTDMVNDSTSIFYYQVRVYDTDGNKNQSEQIRLDLIKK